MPWQTVLYMARSIAETIPNTNHNVLKQTVLLEIWCSEYGKVRSA